MPVEAAFRCAEADRHRLHGHGGEAATAQCVQGSGGPVISAQSRHAPYASVWSVHHTAPYGTGDAMGLLDSARFWNATTAEKVADYPAHRYATTPYRPFIRAVDVAAPP